MDAIRIGIVLCRVGAVLLAVQAINVMSQSIPSLLVTPDYSSPYFWFFLISAVPTVLAAIVLWTYAERICNFAGPSDSNPVEHSLTGQDLVRLGTTLIGIYVVVNAIASGVSLEVSLWIQPKSDSEIDGNSTIASFGAGLRVGYITRLLLGIALIYGRERIAAALTKARYAGTGAS